jgi:DNA (cytosine-5)-methyltransferase 1
VQACQDRESAEIQSFPAWYEFPGTRTAMMRAIGNAVAVDVAATIERRLLATTRLTVDPRGLS